MTSEDIYASPAYRRSRNVYIAECMFEYFVSLLMADAFLAKLLRAVGFKDSDIGIISSIVSLAFLFQFFSLLLAGRRGSKKTIIIVLDSIGQMLFLSLYALPLLPIDANVRRLLVYVFLAGAYACKYLVSTFLFGWANRFVDPYRRGSYSATKEIVSLIGGMIFTLVMGRLFDMFESSGNLGGGFLMLTLVILGCNVGTFTCLLCIKKDKPLDANQAPKKTLKDILSHTLGNKNFRRLIIISMLANAAKYSIAGFMGTFKTDTSGNGLGMSMTLVSLIAVVESLSRMLVTRPLGKYADKHSFAAGFYLSMFVAAGAFLCIMFTNETTWFLVIGYVMLFAMSAAGTQQNSFNMTYSYVDADYIAEALALRQGICGMVSFMCAFVASRILDAVQRAGNMVFGIHIYGQQILGGISMLFALLCVVYMRCTILKEKVVKQ